MRVELTALPPGLKVFRAIDAASIASDLFQSAFNSAFPLPHACKVLDIEITTQDWYQYVALYTWPDGSEECVGFCNWIKYRNTYLEGGLAVKKDFYRSLPKSEFARFNERGGVAQIIMETAAAQLDDCVAWFGYCGDAKALKVDLRVGFVQLEHPYLIVKWIKDLPDADKVALIDEITRIGEF